MDLKKLRDEWEADPDARIVFKSIELQDNNCIAIKNVKLMAIQDNTDTVIIKYAKEVEIDRKEEHTFVLECRQIKDKTIFNKGISGKLFNIYLREKNGLPSIQILGETQDISIDCFCGSLQTADGVCKKTF